VIWLGCLAIGAPAPDVIGRQRIAYMNDTIPQHTREAVATTPHHAYPAPNTPGLSLTQSSTGSLSPYPPAAVDVRLHGGPQPLDVYHIITPTGATAMVEMQISRGVREEYV
jgi:hypothetical protein